MATPTDAKGVKNCPAKVREDLILSRQEQQGEVFFIVKDPVTRRFFRFREPEEFIIRHLDGTHAQEAIQKKFEEKFGTGLSTEALTAFFARLNQLCLLDDGRQTRNIIPARSLLYLRFKAFDPDRFLTWLLPRTTLFFTRSFLWLSLGLVLPAIVLMLIHTDEIARETPQLLRGSSFFLIWVTFLGVAFSHEFAHGLTCKRYGGEVREMGFILLFFMPAFYCNVSDAWLFGKRQRLIVLFAGVYWQLVLWAVATGVWRVTPPETFLHLLALIVMALCGIHTFFNLNPLIKLDGYYLLSDYLEIPNLRSKAFRYLDARVKSLWGRTPQQLQDLTLRERRVCLYYGLLAGAYSSFFLSFIALRFGGFLTAKYQGLGFLLFVGMLMIVFKNSLKKIFVKSSSGILTWRPVPKSSFKNPIILGVVCLLLAGLFWGSMELKVTGEFKVLPSHNADVRSRVDGIIEAIYVNEGDVVEEGQTIARLAGRDFSSELRKIEAQVTEKRANLKRLQAGPRQEEIDLVRKELETALTNRSQASDRYEEAGKMRAERVARAKAAVEKSQEQYEYFQTYLKMHRELFEQALISRLELDKATKEMNMRQKEVKEAEAALNEVLADEMGELRKALAVAEKEVDESKSKLTLLLAGSRPEEIEATEAEVARLEAERSYVAEQLRLTELTSPISGVVTTPKVEEKLGQQVTRGDLVAEIYDLSSVIAEISIPEKEVGDVRVEDPVVLKARAYFNQEFAGQVVSIAPTATKHESEFYPLEKTIRVTTRIDNPTLMLKPEMTGIAKVYCGKRRLVELMTRRLARFFRVEFWSWW